MTRGRDVTSRLEPVRRRAAIEATFALFMSKGGQVGVDVAPMEADGPIAMIERVDHFIRDDLTISLHIVGVIEAYDGFITAGRDCFDLSQFTGQTPTGTSNQR
jgi:limonene-1,2-epoxide hydrolase